MELIRSTEALASLCQSLVTHPYITVDTEFIRETTFWPQLCLIQIGYEGSGYLIDPLAEGMDLSPFFEILAHPKIVKVMHGCRQDIEIFYKLSGIIPQPLFDTQIAAMACGFGDAVSYENLIRKTVNVRIDKGPRFTDWSRRPLTDAQLTYALSDVTHLCKAYTHLQEMLSLKDRMHWLEEEMSVLINPETYAQSPDQAWRRLKMVDKRSRVLGVLVAVAEWREQLAQERDVPRSRILKDEAIREIALQGPRDVAALSRLRSIPKGFENSRQSSDLLAAIERGLAADPSELPKIQQPADNRPGIGPLVELLKVLLKQRCDACDVAPKLIANVSDLERIASDDAPNVPALKGWRHEVFGQYAIDLKSGKLALACEEDRVILIRQN